MKEREWPYVYWFIDVHETMLEPDWNKHLKVKTFYPNSKKLLREISKRDDVKMVMYTCSHPVEIDDYLSFFKENDINFDFVNENPETTNTKYGDFTKKPYMNVILDDKAGFEAKRDWYLIESELAKYDGKLLSSIYFRLVYNLKGIFS